MDKNGLPHDKTSEHKKNAEIDKLQERIEHNNESIRELDLRLLRSSQETGDSPIQMEIDLLKKDNARLVKELLELQAHPVS